VRCSRTLGVPADAQVNISIVDSGGTHANEYLVGLRPRHGHVTVILEPTDITVPGEYDGAHEREHGGH